MDDLTRQLQSILSDPQTMGKLQGLLGSLGQGEAEKPPEPQPAAGASALAQLLPSQPGSGLPPQALAALAQAAPLLVRASQEDDATRLLRALRPLLGEARQKKVDEAIRILHMLRLLPLLKENGVFSGLLSGLL